MKLYEISENIYNLTQLFENGEIDEKTYNDTLEILNMDLSDKIDNIACYIKQLSAEEKALKEEIEKLNERRKLKQSRIENLKTYIHSTMQLHDINKLETSRNVISLRKSQGKIIIKDEEKFLLWAMQSHDELLNYKKPEINKIELKRFLKDNELEYATLEKSENILIK